MTEIGFPTTDLGAIRDLMVALQVFNRHVGPDTVAEVKIWREGENIATLETHGETSTETRFVFGEGADL